MNRLYSELKGRGLEVLLVSFRERPELIRQVVRERGYVAPVLLDESGDVTGLKYGVFGPPTVYLVDREGRLVARSAGPHDWSRPDVRKAIETLLGPEGRATPPATRSRKP